MRVPLSAAENDIEETFVWQLARRRRRRDVFRIRKAMSLLSENDESAGVSRNFEESSILSRNERPRGVFKFDTRLLKVICDSMAVRFSNYPALVSTSREGNVLSGKRFIKAKTGSCISSTKVAVKRQLEAAIFLQGKAME